jgi:hypothetical protein
VTSTGASKQLATGRRHRIWAMPCAISLLAALLALADAPATAQTPTWTGTASLQFTGDTGFSYSVHLQTTPGAALSATRFPAEATGSGSWSNRWESQHCSWTDTYQYTRAEPHPSHPTPWISVTTDTVNSLYAVSMSPVTLVGTVTRTGVPKFPDVDCLGYTAETHFPTQSGVDGGPMAGNPASLSGTTTTTRSGGPLTFSYQLTRHPDADHDGIPDDSDACPDTPRGTPVGADGCPTSGGDPCQGDDCPPPICEGDCAPPPCVGDDCDRPLPAPPATGWVLLRKTGGTLDFSAQRDRWGAKVAGTVRNPTPSECHYVEVKLVITGAPDAD